MDQLALFERAKALFGQDSLVTASVQNQSTIQSKADLQEVVYEINKEIGRRQEECQHFVECAQDFKHGLKTAFTNGELA